MVQKKRARFLHGWYTSSKKPLNTFIGDQEIYERKVKGREGTLGVLGVMQGKREDDASRPITAIDPTRLQKLGVGTSGRPRNGNGYYTKIIDPTCTHGLRRGEGGGSYMKPPGGMPSQPPEKEGEDFFLGTKHKGHARGRGWTSLLGCSSEGQRTRRTGEQSANCSRKKTLAYKVATPPPTGGQ